MKRLLCIVLSMILILSTPISVQAASKKEINAVTKQVTTYLKATKDYNTLKIAKCFVKNCNDQMIVDKTLCNYIQSKNKKFFEYRIRKVTVKGKKASVKIYYCQYNNYYATWYAIKQMGYDSYFYNKKFKTSTMVKYMKKYYKNVINAEDPYEYQEFDELYHDDFITIPLVKKNGKWKIEKITNKMKRMMDCGTLSAVDDFDPDYIWDNFY